MLILQQISQFTLLHSTRLNYNFTSSFMCGICGVASHCPAAPRVMRGLKCLEYRGYDSSGIVDPSLNRVRATGKLQNLQDLLQATTPTSKIAIGHTRWATHGKPLINNAHPHICGDTAVVHNGIIENYSELKTDLQKHGFQFESDTDTEVIAVLVEHLRISESLSPFQAVHKAVSTLRGSYACCFVFKNQNIMIAASHGSPLAFGVLQEQSSEILIDQEYYFASDPAAFTPFAQHMYFMKDGDIIQVNHDSQQSYTCSNSGKTFQPVFQVNHLSESAITKGVYKHFMLKEIHEQPRVIRDAVSNTLALLQTNKLSLRDFSQIKMLACGTSYHSCLTAKYLIEKLTKIPVDVELASEFIYRSPAINCNMLCIFVSQSGETRDTLAAFELCKQASCKSLAVVNVISSALARKCDYVFSTMGGPEVGVASTKAFIAQLSVLFTLAIESAHDLSSEDKQQLFDDLYSSSDYIENMLSMVKSDVSAIAHDLQSANSLIFLGRGDLYSIALEGALKYKELCYEHAEGYAAGELKHGPIALIDSSVPVICCVPSNSLFEKMVSNLQEIAARDGHLIIFTDQTGKDTMSKILSSNQCKYVVLPKVPDLIQPIIYVVPLQLLAYHTANVKGLDVDQPRNLAKCVTVE